MLNPIYAYGNHGLITQELGADGISYVGTAKKWHERGLIGVSIDFEHSPTFHSAEDNPAFAGVLPSPAATGTFTLFGVSAEEEQEIMSVDYSAEWGVGYGSDLPLKFFGMSFDTNVSDGSKDKYVIYKVCITGLPSITTETVPESGAPEPRNAEFPVRVFPLFMNNERLPIYNKINSVKNTVGYAANKDGIVLPI